MKMWVKKERKKLKSRIIKKATYKNEKNEESSRVDAIAERTKE